MNNESYNVGLSNANLTKRELAEKIKEYIPELVIISSEFGKEYREYMARVGRFVPGIGKVS